MQHLFLWSCEGYDLGAVYDRWVRLGNESKKPYSFCESRRDNLWFGNAFERVLFFCLLLTKGASAKIETLSAG